MQEHFFDLANKPALRLGVAASSAHEDSAMGKKGKPSLCSCFSAHRLLFVCPLPVMAVERYVPRRFSSGRRE